MDELDVDGWKDGQKGGCRQWTKEYMYICDEQMIGCSWMDKLLNLEGWTREWL